MLKRKTFLGATCVITGLGYGTDANYKALVEYQSGIKKTEITGIGEESVLAQQIGEDVFKVDKQCKLTRLEQLMVSAAQEVIKKSGIEKSNRLGVVFSTTKGNIAHLQNANVPSDSNIFLDIMAQNVIDAIDIKTEPIVVSNACISGVVAVNVAARLIRANKFDNIIIIAGDEASPFVVSGFIAFKSVSKEICRPYDAKRDGLSMGEAVGALLITSDEQLSCGIAIGGGAVTNDANHISGPSRTGEPLATAICQALEESNLRPEDISFVNAHGTATIYNDEMESKALSIAKLSSTPLNSLKPYFGHTLGASGTIEIAMCAEQMKHSLLIGTRGFETQGTTCPLNVCAKHRYLELTHCLKIASGFGGCNVAIVLSKADKAVAIEQNELKEATCVKSCSIENGILLVNNKVIIERKTNFDEFIREVYHSLDEPNMKFFKMDNMCKMGYVGARYLLNDIEHKPNEIALILANRSSSLDTDIRHQKTINDGELASPAIFVYTLANIVAGEISISNKIQGETTFFIMKNYNKKGLYQYAQLLLGTNRYKGVVVGWCDYLNENYKLNLEYITN